MDVSKELKIIDDRNWNKPTLKIAATNIILALKAINDYATSTNKDIKDITPKELLDNLLEMD